MLSGLKKGGSGRGADYSPWITVRDLGSRGRSHRVYGHTTQRTHHLLSDIELAVFLIVEWQESTADIREQFPLRFEETKALAANALFVKVVVSFFMLIVFLDSDKRYLFSPSF